ncbi:hypothetical protein K2X05_10465, partial [bacterium]|nr:hypothetical protein [bacterium]
PYQPNGIYNRPPGFNEQRPYDRRPMYEGSIGTPNSLSGRRSGGRTSYLGGTQQDALFYSMMGDARERISRNQAEWNQQLPLINGGASMEGYAGSNSYSPFTPGLDMHPLLRSLLMGGNPGASFNLQTYTGY